MPFVFLLCFCCVLRVLKSAEEVGGQVVVETAQCSLRVLASNVLDLMAVRCGLSGIREIMSLAERLL